MTRLRGIVKAVVTMAGVVSLSSPLLVSGTGDMGHKGQKGRQSRDGHERGLSGADSPPAFTSGPETHDGADQVG
jgi:hypothetical protein